MINPYQLATDCMFKPRLKLMAPWLQGRITDVCAPFDIPPQVPIPGDQYWFAGSGTNVASPIATYFYNCGR